MKYSRVSLLAFLFVVGQVSAGEPAADFSISASVAPGGVMPPGTEGVVTISITNHGPDDDTPLFGMLRTDDGTGVFNFPPLHFEFPEALLTGRCVAPPVQLPPEGEFLSWIIADMTAGERVECTYAFTVANTSVTIQVGRWAVRPFSGAGDPNDTNNVADVLLRFAEAPEPVSVPVLSPQALVILMVMLGLIGVFGLAKHSEFPLSTG